MLITRRSIIGAILALSGCGSITLAPQDLDPSGVADSGNPSSSHDGLTTPVPTDGSLFGTSVDVLETHTETPEEPPSKSSEAGTADASPIDAGTITQTCNPGTCYRKSDPDHTTCPCHY